VVHILLSHQLHNLKHNKDEREYQHQFFQQNHTIPQYGRIELYLKGIMDKQNLTRNAVARAIDTRFEVVNKWYNIQFNTSILWDRIGYILHQNYHLLN